MTLQHYKPKTVLRRTTQRVTVRQFLVNERDHNIWRPHCIMMKKVTSEIERRDESRFKLYLRQCMTALGPLLGVILSGMTSGYSAVLLPQLKVDPLSVNTSLISEAEEIRISTIEEESWIASAAVLPMAPGCWIAGFMMEQLGRRMSVMLVFPLFFIGWITVGLANNFACLIIGRLICGLCTGLLGPLVPVYISETSCPQLRSILLGAITLSLSLGIIFVHALGTWLHWRLTVYICAILPIICLLTCFMSRESPTWLLSKGKAAEAQKSWIYLRGQESMEEYYMLENSRIEDAESRQKKRSIWSSLKETFSSRYFVQPFGILCLFFFTAQFAGTNVVVFYSVSMLADVSGPENAYMGSLIVDTIRVIFSVLACYLVKKYNRRALTFLSGFGTTVTLFFLSASLYFEIGKPFLPVACLIAYTALLPLGIIPLPWMLCGELFPRKFRGLGSGLTSGFTFICFFMVIKMAPGMFELLQPYGTFAIYGTVAFLGTSLLYLTLPETKDKTLQEIERAFDKKPSKSHMKNIEATIPECIPLEKTRA